MQPLQQIRIVLVEPTHPGNIGAVARSMKTMGLTELILVNPKKFPHYEASKRAVSAEDVLNNAVVVDEVHLAIQDCTLVLGTSAREREVSWPMADARTSAEAINQHLSSGDNCQRQRVAILFGRESSGLSNAELDLCAAQICVPANPEYSSLNLASAVQIICYELRMSLSKPIAVEQQQAELNPQQQRQQAADFAQRNGHMQHLEEVLGELEFIHHKPPTMLMRKLTRLYNKAQLSVEEIQILRGILTAIQSAVGRSKRN